MNTIKEYPVLKANLIIRGKIVCKTGLHIGGSKEKLEIGGLDSPVIRSPRTNYPYIPGSSLKGKMRHLLEYITGAIGNPIEDKLGNVSKDKDIVRIFGIGADEKEKIAELKNIGLAGLTVRDAHPSEETAEQWKTLNTELEYTEYKPENTIDRVTSAANPRFIERVIEGSEFDFEMIYSVYQWEGKEGESKQENTNGDIKDNINGDIDNVFTALKLLEHSALGKSGSRGYGRIEFKLAEPIWLKAEDYRTNSANYKKSIGKIEGELKSLADTAVPKLTTA